MQMPTSMLTTMAPQRGLHIPKKQAFSQGVAAGNCLLVWLSPTFKEVRAPGWIRGGGSTRREEAGEEEGDE